MTLSPLGESVENANSRFQLQKLGYAFLWVWVLTCLRENDQIFFLLKSWVALAHYLWMPIAFIFFSSQRYCSPCGCLDASEDKGSFSHMFPNAEKKALFQGRGRATPTCFGEAVDLHIIMMATTSTKMAEWLILAASLSKFDSPFNVTNEYRINETEKTLPVVGLHSLRFLHTKGQC